MKNSSTNARNADSGSTHRFPYIWNLTDLDDVEKNGKTVFSCFSCGGGSSMGYKLAGYTVLGNVEIDPAINDLYVKNNHPKYNFMMDIRDFEKLDGLPEELFDLDILDGSPPCSTFSMAGNREEGWGKQKVFREGQAKQTLDDLFVHFINVVKKLKPKCFVAENVKGLIAGNAKGYVNEILRLFDEAGYKVQIFLLNAASMGVPQKRERVFFIGHKKELDFDKLKLRFVEPPILYGEFADEQYIPLSKDAKTYERWKQRRKKDKNVGDTVLREEGGKLSGFTLPYIHLDRVAATLTSGGLRPIRFDKPGQISDRDIAAVQSFPQDYDFGKVDRHYVCGMSVPPVMMANIASEIYDQWLKGEKNV